eukprot:TRINITY_DN4067_c0_g1_i1.p2 TRINITY_DN4067_c0_g1~~TRINITY_DN4067_c0_g1_i1.p2  ORF type:complete len:85 (-),score=26.23 TRINITY_DN4067_c0_g1_i1:120-374(-)
MLRVEHFQMWNVRTAGKLDTRGWGAEADLGENDASQSSDGVEKAEKKKKHKRPEKSSRKKEKKKKKKKTENGTYLLRRAVIEFK